MQQRIWGALLWLALLPLVGSVRLIWRFLAMLAALPPKTLLLLVGLAVALSLPNPVSAQLTKTWVLLPEHVILVRGLLALSVGVLYHGLRSPGLRRLWWSLTRGGR